VTTTLEPIGARRMGHYTHPPEYHRPTPLTLGPNLPDAACKGGGNLWDANIDGEEDDERAQRHTKATASCNNCPEQAACLTQRLTNPTLGPGIWGGQLFEHKQGNCTHCGGPITNNNYSTLRKYCSDTCEKQAAVDRKRNRRNATRPAPVTQNCRICDLPFTPKHKNQITCGPTCQRDNYTRRQRERRKTTAA